MIIPSKLQSYLGRAWSVSGLMLSVLAANVSPGAHGVGSLSPSYNFFGSFGHLIKKNPVVSYALRIGVA